MRTLLRGRNVVARSIWNAVPFAFLLLFGQATAATNTTNQFQEEAYVGVGAIMGIMWGAICVCTLLCVACRVQLVRLRRVCCEDSEWTGYTEDFCCCITCCVDDCCDCCTCCDDCCDDDDDGSALCCGDDNAVVGVRTGLHQPPTAAAGGDDASDVELQQGGDDADAAESSDDDAEEEGTGNENDEVAAATRSGEGSTDTRSREEGVPLGYTNTSREDDLIVASVSASNPVMGTVQPPHAATLR